MLTAAAIMSAVENEEIMISDFSTERLNPHSYNLRLSPKLLRYTSHNLDLFKENPVEEVEISKEGYLLRPDEFYLGSTIESTYTPKHIPCIDGRSSIARLGIFVHVTAGFGDIGFNGRWTLEIVVAKPIVIYPEIEIAQIYFENPEGIILPEYTYHGKYQNAEDVMASKMYIERNK